MKIRVLFAFIAFALPAALGGCNFESPAPGDSATLPEPSPAAPEPSAASPAAPTLPPAPPIAAASPPPPAPIELGDGRAPITVELGNAPYKYIGRIMNPKDPSGWGTATLIGPRHVVTAAHVIERAVEFEAALGPVTFVLPDGRSSVVGDVEMDGGWRYGLPPYDLAILALEDDLGRGGNHAAWGVFDDETMLDTSMHVTGYDGDLWRAAGRPAHPALYDRAPVITSSNRMLVGAGVVALGSTMTVTAVGDGFERFFPRAARHAGPIAGGATALGGVVLGLGAYEADRLAWVGESGVQMHGVSGGPLWINEAGKPTIVGIAGHADTLTFGHLPYGSKITPGACEDMIANFIATHP